MLIAGYGIPGINDDDTALRSCLLLRERLRYVKTASAWRWWLGWYAHQPVGIRLYDLVRSLNETWQFRQRSYSAELRAERFAAYEALFTANSDDDENTVSPQWATVGRYNFSADGLLYDVEVSEGMAFFAYTPVPARDLHKHSKREPVSIDLEALLQTALDLDNREAAMQIVPPGNWHERLSGFHLATFNKDRVLEEQRQFQLEGLFHLAGALGVGKSSLIWVLSYHLAYREGWHVTVVVNTVVEAIRLATWLRRLGVATAPALGRNRAAHEAKYGLANADVFRTTSIFQQDAVFDPALAWMPTPCALSGGQNTPIPTGKEPCFSLYAEKERFACPLIPVCPVHQLPRDLVESQVWVVNPMSFLYSTISGFGKARTPLFEAVYHRSDVLIVDEADRVQVQWDAAFAPMRLLAGNDDALLDSLHRIISEASVGVIGRRKAARGVFNRLTTIDAQAHILSSHLFHLLLHTPALVKWIDRRPLTNNSLFGRLVKSFAKTSPKASNPETLAKALTDEFRHYWANPLRQQERTFFHGWMSQLLGTDILERNLERQLASWATERLGWAKTLDKRKRLLLRKLDFCLTFAALLKRTNDVFYFLNWIGDELNVKENLRSTDFEPADVLVNLIPDPPLGVLLGARLVHHVPGQSLGVLNAMRYRGIGRWLLLNFPSLYQVQAGWLGPHILLTSATSWLPRSAQFHLALTPNALLLPANDLPVSNIEV